MSGGQREKVTWYSGLQVQTTNAAAPIPIVWGSNLITATCVWYGDFIVKQKPAKGGKGGAISGATGGSSKQNVYYASLIEGLCEGPIVGVARCYEANGVATSLMGVSSGLALMPGNDPQPAWSYVSGAHPNEALGYNGVAYVFAYEYDLGPGATVGSTSFEVVGVFGAINPIPINDRGQIAYIGEDADPALIIEDFLTNPQYGVGFPASSIDTATLLGANGRSYQAYCGALGFAMSPALTSQEAANSILARWLKLTNSTCVWSSGLLKFLPFGDTALSGDGWTWTPNTTPIYALTDDDFVDQGDVDPVQITRSDPYSTPNKITLEIRSRLDDYNTGPIEVWDQSHIDRYGLRHGGSTSANEICSVPVGQLSAQLILQRDLYIRRKFKIKASWVFGLLDPMDLIALIDPLLGLNAEVVRITEIEEADDGLLSITAEEYPQGVATAVAYPIQSGGGYYPPVHATAGAIAPPIIFEPPSAITGGAAQIWAAVAPFEADPNWGGCFVWASFDGVSFAEVATINGASTMGATTATLPIYVGANPDAADTLAVSMAASGLPLASVSDANAAAGVTTCYVGGEYIAYTTATLTGVNLYSLTGLYRGLGSVSAATIPAFSPFVLLSGTLLKYTIPASLVGSTIYLKFQSFNIFGAGVQDIGDCVIYTFSPSGEGLPYGPVTAALLYGLNLDYGHVSGDAVALSDDWGGVTTLASVTIDLGGVT